MKLVIQIPCFNEEENITNVILALPKLRDLPGIDALNILIINDGSTDGTLARVNELKDDRLFVLDLKRNVGLAQAFELGIAKSIELGADIIVNTDGDGQYLGSDVFKLCEPILMGTADVVIGDRRVSSVREFSASKKLLQIFGSKITSKLVGSKISDATSGFRSYRTESISAVVLSSKFSYTLESIVQLKALHARIVTVQINRMHTNRPSRLFNSNLEYVKKNGLILFRTSLIYRPLPVFSFFAFIFFCFGLTSWLPVLVDILGPNPSPHVQSTILGSVFMMAAILSALIGVIADSLLKNTLISQKIIGNQRLLAKGKHAY
jgi:glycosyltransferase involved in cell wall biosynthesis